MEATPNRDIRRHTVRVLGSLPAVAAYMRRLKVAELVDEHCPSDEGCKHTHGKVFAALVANRLTAACPLYHVEKWAAAWAVEAVLGIPACELNDDRLGRMLDRVAEQAEGIKGSLALQARDEFSLPIQQFLWDLTSVMVVGEYPEEEQEKAYARVCFGYGSRGKQVRVGQAVAMPGAIPLTHQTFPGSTTDVSTLAKVLPKLKALMQQERTLITGDSKLLSAANVAAMEAEGVRFIAPGGRREVIVPAVAGVRDEDWKPLSYQSERDRLAKKPLGYRGAETTTVVEYKGKRFELRRVLIESSEERAACRRSRARQMQRAEARLVVLERNAGSRHYPTEEDVYAAARRELKNRRVDKFYQIEVGAAGEGEQARPFLRWSRNQEVLAATERLDGIYALDTNSRLDEQDTDSILQAWKEQKHVERRMGDSKGALVVRPVFVKDNKRLVALILVVMIALMVYSLIEYEVRRKLGKREKLANLLAGHVAARPTGENLLRALAHWYLVETPEGRFPTTPDELQAEIMQLLGVPLPECCPRSSPIWIREMQD